MKKLILIIFLVLPFLFFAKDEVYAQACSGFVKCSAYDEGTRDCSVDQSWVNTIACDGPGCTAGGTCEGGCEISNGCSSGGGGGLADVGLITKEGAHPALVPLVIFPSLIVLLEWRGAPVNRCS
ncbi:MAG TPA: hypothetical protein PLA27_14420 [Anaerolineales bacterium]|jgi:hypothetical protein|nr:hypothetical protein [Anaerolineales bacterium]HQX17615.1 hypothetical protein [Anaerolineales bacterium]